MLSSSTQILRGFGKSQLRCRFSTFLKEKAYVNGKWVSAASGKTFQVTNPVDGSVIASVPDMNKEDAKTAVDVAHKAFDMWRNKTAKERSTILRKWYELMVSNQEDLGKLLTTEMGKPLTEAKGEVVYGGSYLEWFAEEAKRTYGDVIPAPTSNKRMITIKQPVGVATFITPWNFPNAMITRKAGAALAIGCTCVLKPAEDTPLSALAMCQLAEEAGMPPGVFNVVTSSRENSPEVGEVLSTSPKVAAISFTGSTEVGKILMKQAAGTVKKTGMELGGNAPFIVFDSADIDNAITGAMASKFRASGQTCVCANRILVQDSVHDEFVKKLAERMDKELVVGNGMDAGVTQGPLINKDAADKVESFIKDAVNKGAKVIRGGKRHKLGETFIEPTLLTGVNTSMLCGTDEIFGPVAAIMRFKTEDEVLKVANSSPHGLAGYFYSNDINQIWRVAEKLEVGIVGINEGLTSCVEAPFGGVKQSGIGKEGSKYGMEEYTEIKYLCFGGLK